jgi:hypothetical protein
VWRRRAGVVQGADGRFALDRRGRLAALQAVTGADELLVTTITYRHEDRVASHTLLGEEWASRNRVTTR